MADCHQDSVLAKLMRHCRQVIAVFLTASLIAGSAYADVYQLSAADRNPVDFPVHEQNPDIDSDTAIAAPGAETCPPQSICPNPQIAIARMDMNRRPLPEDLHHQIAGRFPGASHMFSPDNPPPVA